MSRKSTQQSYYQRTLSVLIVVLGLVCTLAGQQVYPVFLQGMLIGPHSQNLSDYAFEKSQDIYFVATLQDPIEAFRMVKYRLSILNNGNEIMYTDPNYNPPPVMLEKDIPLMIDGLDLAGYFEAANLVNSDGQTPGILLPEGFNGICLEVIDIIRNVPISDRICAFGYFESSDPPILNTPICGSTISKTETQNFVFSWLTQHESSLNPPTTIEYEFTMVEVLPDQSPNDAFIFSLPIYQTTTFSPTLFYMEDAPILEAGKLYAWVVRAFDSQGTDLFSNNGYSEICTFSILPEITLTDDETKNFNCQNAPCLWEGELSSIPLGTQLTAGDKVELGHFSMEISEILSFDNQTYQGEGTIYIPFLSTKLKVSFTNISVNEDLRVFSGTVYNSKAENNELIPPLFDIQNLNQITGFQEQIDQGFHNDFADALHRYFTQTKDSNFNPNLVSILSNIPQENAIPITVPIGIDPESKTDESSKIVVITGMKFEPTRASLNAVLVTRLNPYDDWLKFGTKEFCFQPGGLPQAESSELELLSDTDLDLLSLGIKFKGIGNEKKGSYLSWNCNGFEEFTLSGNYGYDENYYQTLENPTFHKEDEFNLSTTELSNIANNIIPDDTPATVRINNYGEQTYPWYVNYIPDDLREGKYYSNLPAYAERAAELLGKDNFLYDRLIGLKNEIEGYLLLVSSSGELTNKHESDVVKRSIKKIKKALEYYDENALDYYLLSIAFSRIHEIDSAYHYSRLAAKYSPTWTKAHARVSNVYMQNGQPTLAKKWIDKAIEKDSTDVSLFNQRAFNFFTKAFRPAHNPKNKWQIRSYTNTDDIPYDRQAHEDMRTWSNYSLGFYPNAEAYKQLGLSHTILGEYTKAESYFLQVILLQPINMNAYRNLLFIYGKTGQTSKLAALLEKIKNTQPTANNKTLETLAIGYLLLKENDKFLTQYNSLESRGKQDPNFLYEISRIQSVQNNTTEALQYLQKAIDQGFSDKQDLIHNTDLDNIRTESNFLDIMKKLTSD